jgi:hypothetical protein
VEDVNVEGWYVGVLSILAIISEVSDVAVESLVAFIGYLFRHARPVIIFRCCCCCGLAGPTPPC